VSRSFTPEITVPEDPVCGSAHCQIADYWARTLGKKVIRAYQASARGGELLCEPLGNGRIALSGKAVLVAASELVVPL
jgi:predicted PhzF superfamily epimerase YddE/YHI9